MQTQQYNPNQSVLTDGSKRSSLPSVVERQQQDLLKRKEIK